VEFSHNYFSTCGLPLGAFIFKLAIFCIPMPVPIFYVWVRNYLFANAILDADECSQQ
jgi:hypothetical protein